MKKAEAKNVAKAKKGLVKILNSYNEENIIALSRFLNGLPSMTDCDRVFKRVVAEASRRWGSPNYIVANVMNGTKQELVSRRTRAYRTIASAVDKAKAKYGKRNRLLSLDGVVSVRDGDHYIAFISGGNNGHSNWRAYFESLMMILEECKDAWIIELDNDCCDDVHYALVGFRVGGKK